jgi:hypothetical protein
MLAGGCREWQVEKRPHSQNLQKRREAEGFATSCLIVPLVAEVAKLPE